MNLSFSKTAVCFLFCVLLSFNAGASSSDDAPKEWTTWLENLKKEMLAKGISQKTIDAAYKGKNYYHKVSAVVEQDKKQTEFVLTTCNYVNRLVNENRVKEGRKQYKILRKKYSAIEEKYGVPLYYLTAFWAIETNFGKNKGQYHLIDSLTNLSYKNRRSEFFKNELYNVLKIMDKTNLKGDKIRGSWAGAMGHFQFMPSTYNHYGVDGDGDGVADIWDNFSDALASAGNYLSSLGWKKDEPWGKRVSLPWDFDFKISGRKTTKTVAEWKELGIKSFDGSELNFADDMKGSIILPDGRKGPAYIIFGNFKRIMIWNRSDNYALAVAILADYIKNENKKVLPLEASMQYVMNSDEILKIQKFHNKLFSPKLKEDGKLGPKTREGIKKIQKKAHLPQDGYPDYQLLNKINNYKNGFRVMPHPSKKSVKDKLKKKA
jgi:membrane-bound lytic murein transglycosylase B